MASDPLAVLPEIRADVTLAAAAVANDRLAPSARRMGATELAYWAPRLLAAVEAALKVTDPLRNETLGGMFMAVLHLQVCEAITRELLGEGGAVEPEPEDYECPTCGAPAGERCLRLVKDPRTGAVHRRTEADPPPPVGKRYASHAHGERRELAALAKETPDGT